MNKTLQEYNEENIKSIRENNPGAIKNGWSPDVFQYGELSPAYHHLEPSTLVLDYFSVDYGILYPSDPDDYGYKMTKHFWDKLNRIDSLASGIEPMVWRQIMIYARDSDARHHTRLIEDIDERAKAEAEIVEGCVMTALHASGATRRGYEDVK